MAQKRLYKAEVLSSIKSVKADDEGDLIIEGFANTVTKDRAGDIIPKEAWQAFGALENFLKNPIILAFHDHSKPIGKMLSHEVTDLGLKIKAKISKGAGNVHELIKDGTLSAFSVGFVIKDARFDDKTDTYFITEVELHEVSVVSVPCNQDSVFSVAKSMDTEDFKKFKHEHLPIDKEIKMTTEELQAMLEELKSNSTANTEEAVKKAIAEMKAAEKAEKAAKEKAEKEAEARATETKEAAKKAAEELVDQLKKEMEDKNGNVNELVKAQQDQIIALKDEIAQVVASRNKPFNAVTTAMKNGVGQDQEKDIDNLVMLSTIKKVDMFDTSYGKQYKTNIKAVNPSSSIQVSSDGYETVFATNLIRDIQAALVVAPLFTEMTMTSANLTIPVNPNRGNATWVAAAAMNDGSDPSRTGAENTVTLTERTLTTFKLAAKTYLTEETEEDAILSLVPVLRQHLVEAHANEMDRAFLIGSGAGQPKGLVTQAEAVASSAQTQVTAAKADGSVLVTAKDLLAARRKLGLYGVNLKDIVAIVSQDAYWDLIQDPEWGDVQQVGMDNATKLNGEVGNVYGMPVVVSNQFAAKAVSTSFAVLVNKTNFVTTRQRGVTLRSDFDVELDRTVFVATQRVNLEPLIEASTGNGKGVVSLTYAAV